MSAYKTITSDNITVGTTLTFPNRCTINNMPTGTASQVLITNASGQPVYGSIPSGTISGGNNEQSMWNVSGVSTWQSRSFRFGIMFAKFTSQNWNSGATTALTFSNITLNSQTFGPNTFTNLSSLVAGSSFTCNTSGYYLISVFCCLSNGGIGTSSVRFNVLINGLVTNPGPCIQLGLGATGSITASFPLLISAGQTIEFRSSRMAGTDILTSDANNNSIAITLLQSLA